MGRSKHRVTLSDGRFLKFYTSGSNGGDTVMRLTFNNRDEYEIHVGSTSSMKFETGYRPFWIKQELASLREKVKELENIKDQADKVSDAYYEFIDDPGSIAERVSYLESAIFNYHNKWQRDRVLHD